MSLWCIELNNKSLHRLRALPVAAMLLFVFLVTTTQAGSWDNELRCCLTHDDVKGAFLVNLTTPGTTRAEMRLTLPSGERAGFNPKQKQYRKPVANVIYASAAAVDAPVNSRQWHQGRNRQLVLRNLEDGDHLLEVIGVRSGHYFLSFYPGGQQAPRGAVFINGRDGTKIRQGEVHRYRFPGKFDDVFDGSISSSSPTWFRVKRVK